jgi:molybdenum cofactor cytidylyltransferase
MITAIILAAGESRRMGRPKMLMPWGSNTVLGQVVTTIEAAGIEDILVVTGGSRAGVEALLGEFPGIRSVFNPDFGQGEMLGSIQIGLAAAPPRTRAALICLGDQPQIREETVRRVCEAYEKSGSDLVVPSFQNRRGHPWLVTRRLWAGLMGLKPSDTPRDFLNANSKFIHYVEARTSTVVEDLDTPEDHNRFNPPPTDDS